MRHIRTLIVAVFVAPLAWVLLALGEVRSDGAFGHTASSTLHAGSFVRPLLLLGAAGLLLGLLATLRVSPLGAVAIGVLYTLSYVLLLVAPGRVVRVLPDDLYVAGHLLNLSAPLRSGTAAVLGVLLLVAAASGQRWRAWPRPGADEPAAGEPLDADRPLGTEGLGLTPYRPYDETANRQYDETPSRPYDEEPTTRERTLTGPDTYRW
ncbi:hypothetical protein [Dactylosporangium sp. CA-139066]|uniref:hypothetical protein n=1 Tax=Dactylosporangium sp. CA-139066 TaxID=3239930 RepID=UPI003D91E751